MGLNIYFFTPSYMRVLDVSVFEGIKLLNKVYIVMLTEEAATGVT